MPLMAFSPLMFLPFGVSPSGVLLVKHCMGSELAPCTTILRVSWPWWGKDVFMHGLWLPALPPPRHIYVHSSCVWEEHLAAESIN